VFIPDNLNLVKGYPDIRRCYLDNIAIMQNKSHGKCLSEYKNALKQRCAVCISRNYDKNMLDIWDDILIKQGINLIFGRLKYLNLIKSYAGEIYNELSGGEQLEILYFSDVFGIIGSLDISNKDRLYEIYKQSLNEITSEGQLGKTPGAHRDDVLFKINDKNARNYASQGQMRSIAVALKLAEAGIIRDYNRENPVVLLDEVLGELDANRREYVIKHFVDSQVFITSCNTNDFENMGNIKVWSVDNGVFTPRQ
jgi:DNA replication and repair protein RecF